MEKEIFELSFYIHFVISECYIFFYQFFLFISVFGYR